MKKLLIIFAIALVGCDGEFRNNHGCVITEISISGENAVYDCEPLCENRFGRILYDPDQETIYVYDAVNKYKLNDTLIFQIKK